jgi:hypothetical protein
MTPVRGRAPGKGRVVRKKQRMAVMADEALARQATDRARRTEAGRQLRDGSHGDERADRWQEGLSRERAGERGGGS